MESPLAVANFFIQKSFDTGKEMTPMKLVKLVYISHGWNLGLYDKPLINEGVQAWKYGPVIASIYHAFKHHGSRQITNLEAEVVNFQPVMPCIHNSKELLLNKIWDVYADNDGIQLSALTHQPGTPWDIVWNQGSNKIEGAIIPNDLIKSHYKQKIAGNA